jgi:hypothetical protein
VASETCDRAQLMLNPWGDLPDRAPFVAPADATYINRYPTATQGLQLDLLPSPCLGKPDARVYLLLLNPGGRHATLSTGVHLWWSAGERFGSRPRTASGR